MKTIYAIAAVLCAYLSVTDPSDTPTTSTLDGIAATKAELRTDAGKQRACGPNASWREIDATTIQCVSKKNKPTVKVSL
jgi:hypothetical protein